MIDFRGRPTVGGNRNDFAVYEKCRSDNRFIGRLISAVFV